MGPANPWSPEWRPDPTGRRAAAIRASKRGALLAALLLGGLTVAAVLAAPEVTRRPPFYAVGIAAMAVPAFALLGAALGPTAIGSRVDAVAAGVALAVGAPVAAVTSAVIAIFVLFAIASDGALLGQTTGAVIRFGVLSAWRLAPLLILAVVLWVIGVRRLGGGGATVEGPKAEDRV